MIQQTREYAGWNVRGIYEGHQPDILETEAFFMAFGRIRNIDGHKIMCVMTPAKEQAQTEYDGIHRTNSVLLVSWDDMRGMTVNDTLRVDGHLFVINEVSRPAGDIVRLSLTSNE